MRIPTFIGLSSLVLCTWLGVAFFREVPVHSYPFNPVAMTGGAAKPSMPPVAMTTGAAPTRKP